MLRFASSSEDNCTSADRRYLAAAASLPSSSAYGLVAGDINLSTAIGSMSSSSSPFGRRRRQYSEDDDNGKVPAADVAAAAVAPPLDSTVDDLLPSPRRRALDSFVPLMSMASFDDHHPFFVDDDDDDGDHNTSNSDALQANESRYRSASEDRNNGTNDDDDTDGKPKKSTAGDRANSSFGTGSLPDGLSMPMADPDDESNGFSPTMCFVRQQLEFFLADAKDADARRKKGGVSGNVKPGSLGFRCIHCKTLPPSQRAPSADAYPNQVQLIYQSVRNFQRHHFLKCPSVPKRLKEQYEALPRRQKSKRPVHKHTNPWVFSANRKGIADVPDDTCKGGYRIFYSAPDPSADNNTKVEATAAGAAAESSANTSTTAASSSSSSTSAAVSSSYYGISVFPPTPIQVGKEPKRKKSRRS